MTKLEVFLRHGHILHCLRKKWPRLLFAAT